MNKILSWFAAVLLALPLGAGAQQVNELKPPVPVDAGPAKVEVLEFFSYACIHCYNLEPALETWAKKLPKDVEFRRVPAVFNERMGLDASIFYAMEAMGVLDKLHRPLFDAIHKDRLRTDNQQAFSEWLTRQGVDANKFVDTVRSFGVRSKARRAAQLTIAYKIDATPTMAVHGRYTLPAQLSLVDSLVERVRKEK
ncbi:MAG: thiol:disulfide interchange protein DsbA/DsbL [Burkholderiales bacterium]